MIILPWVAAVGGPVIAFTSSILYQEYKDKRSRRLLLTDETAEEHEKNVDRREERDIKTYEITINAYKEIIDGYKQQLVQIAELHKSEMARQEELHEKHNAWLISECARLQKSVQLGVKKSERLQTILSVTDTAVAMRDAEAIIAEDILKERKTAEEAGTNG